MQLLLFRNSPEAFVPTVNQKKNNVYLDICNSLETNILHQGAQPNLDCPERSGHIFQRSRSLAKNSPRSRPVRAHRRSRSDLSGFFPPTGDLFPIGAQQNRVKGIDAVMGRLGK